MLDILEQLYPAIQARTNIPSNSPLTACASGWHVSETNLLSSSNSILPWLDERHSSLPQPRTLIPKCFTELVQAASYTISLKTGSNTRQGQTDPGVSVCFEQCKVNCVRCVWVYKACMNAMRMNGCDALQQVYIDARRKPCAEYKRKKKEGRRKKEEGRRKKRPRSSLLGRRQVALQSFSRGCCKTSVFSCVCVCVCVEQDADRNRERRKTFDWCR